MQIHVVRRGETLWRIAQQYRVDPERIAALNALPDPNVLLVGQALLIPVPEGVYVVQPGDTAFAIANRYGTTVAQLQQWNPQVDLSRLTAGQVLRVPPLPRRTVETNAYLTDFGAPGQRTVQEAGAYFTYLSPFSHHVRPDGSLEPPGDDPVLPLARQARIAPWCVVTNWAGDMFNSDVAHAFLRNPAAQDAFLRNVLALMRAKGYTGLNVDFEYLYPRDREAYNRFLARIRDPLRQAGYLLSSALAPKFSGTQVGLLYEAHDYEVHGRLCDLVILMTYEWGWAGGPPWAVAPVSEVRRVLDYAVTVIPRDKILMGFPVYARDWTLPFQPGTVAETISPQEALARAIAHQAAIHYHPSYQAPYFRYTDPQGRRHEVWFEDARSIEAKLSLVRAYRLRGMSFWEFPSEIPQLWPLLAAHFQVRKVL
ncbi:spore germination protein YaaH [Alicyclobacillus cellulosilyticus]|uniref:Spore germination protein YaaH n=1 Tax=Alicyclobacillus cellulosilyticus TaxID=1003997 RepID=A0A917KCU8_9BACL|nr:LysM peptidoglycan-binding domain-containing protein [Alicyclobacillus cellulosilyticus]GGJ08607.1 spore germination protein YaaH [Alicyclobacillus cellulosilyticus]